MKLVRFVTVCLSFLACRAYKVDNYPMSPDCVHYQLDPGFDQAQKALLLEAMQAWNTGTEGAACFVQGEGKLFVYKVDKQPQQREIELEGGKANHSDPDFIIGLEEDETRIYLLTNKLHDEQDFYAASMHELGHILGLDHYSGQGSSWMYASIAMAPRQSRVLTNQDAEDFCRLTHKCGLGLEHKLHSEGAVEDRQFFRTRVEQAHVCNADGASPMNLELIDDVFESAANESTVFPEELGLWLRPHIDTHIVDSFVEDEMLQRQRASNIKYGQRGPISTTIGSGKVYVVGSNSALNNACVVDVVPDEPKERSVNVREVMRIVHDLLHIGDNLPSPILGDEPQ